MALKPKLRKLWYSLSARQRHIVRRIYFWPSDVLDTVRGKRSRLVPPRGIIYTGAASGPENFVHQGKQQLEKLQKYAGLKSTDSVLDIGSGIGRTAIALTDVLGKEGSYEGFDVVELGVKWCKKRISKAYPNFNFTFVPLFNDLYNTESIKATDFNFPYPDNHFDVVYSFSVFTHMGVDEIAHYLKETRRVLKPGGKCLSTFFTYNDQNENFVASNERFSFPYLHEGFRLMSENVTAGNICLHMKKLNEVMSEAGFDRVELIDGFWKDEVRDESKEEYQDMVIYS